MIEAEITGVCRHIELPDLGLTLDRGDKQYIPYAEAQASMDLHRARQNGAVSVRPVKRFEERRTLPRRPRVSPVVQNPLPQPLASPSTSHTSPPPALIQVIPQVVAQVLEEKIPPGLTREEVAAEVHVQLAGMESRLLAALANMQVAGSPVPRTSVESSGTIQDEPTPVFIPDKLVSADVKGDIKVKRSEAKGTGVADAAAALKAARKSKTGKE